MNPLLILFLIIGAGQQPTFSCDKAQLMGHEEWAKHCRADPQLIQGSVPVAEHKPMVIAGDGVELKLQKNGDVIAAPAPLKCGKYEFEDHPSQFCGDTYPSTCYKPHCAPLTHTVTEKEFQAIMERLRKLEEKEVK